jgi:hypothetical protein
MDDINGIEKTYPMHFQGRQIGFAAPEPATTQNLRAFLRFKLKAKTL